MKSAFVDISMQLKALLEAPAIAGVGIVTRDRLVPVIRQARFAINVKQDKSRGARGGITGSPNDWATDYVIECYARADATAEQVDVVDPLLIAVWERLSTASANQVLLDLGVQDVLPDPEIEWDTREGETPLVVALITTRIIHRTNPGALTAWTGT